jgi:response regulator RpfG family c-di-GMP phosphodiesterase
LLLIWQKSSCLPSLFFVSRIHLCSIGADPNLESRIAPIGQSLKCVYRHFNSIDLFADEIADSDVTTLVFSSIDLEGQSQLAGAVQTLKQLQPNAFIITIVGKKINSETAVFVKKSGASLILSESMVYESSILEYLSSQTIRGSLIPVKPSQFEAQTSLEFSVYALMPLNQKILPAISMGNTISAEKLLKLKNTNELYLKRDDLGRFDKYLADKPNASAEGLDSRCRIQFLDLGRSHFNLVCLLVDSSEASSFTKGRELLEELKLLSKKLMSSLACVSDPWKVLDNSSQSALLLTERATSIAAMAGLMALQMEGMSSDLVTVAALLADIGLIMLPPKTLEHLRTGHPENLTADELVSYHNHPITSINLCLGRKLSLDDKLKNIISTTHEQVNAKGFPKQLIAEKIPLDAQLIHFSVILDDAAQVRMGENPKSISQLRTEIYKAELMDRQKFDISLLQKIKNLDA